MAHLVLRLTPSTSDAGHGDQKEAKKDLFEEDGKDEGMSS